ncbi:MAG: hypothetical protein FJY11_03870 [Bacteroidetes bacterium]|nr:hypothetical protein [Bacteroidota bacterium]
MKKSAYKTISVTAALLILTAWVAPSQEVSRDYSRTFTVTPSEGVVISNRYGDVTVETWNSNEVVIEVKVKVELSSRDRSERLVELINIDFFENDTAVGATTRLDDRFSATTRGTGTNRFSIDYKVKMPAGNNLEISNRYGNVKITEHPGRVNINVRYGNFYALKLTRGNEKPINTISVSYGKAVIEEANWLSVIARYAPEVTVTRVQAMMIDSRYSKVIVDKAGSIVADSKYDNISLREVNNFVAETGYASVKIGSLSGKLDLTTRYGSVEVTSIPAGFEAINIDAAYTGVGLGIAPAAEYRLDARVSYAGLTYCEECLDIQRRIVESTSREIAGVAGTDPNPQATVTIRASYGSVRLR